MADYAVFFARSARKELEVLNEPTVTKIFRRIEALGKEPRPRGCTKLKGGRSLWRIRIEDYRVVYSIDDGNKIVDIVAVRHRSEAYR